MASDGKAQRPEGSAQREARSEHNPIPEGQGGGEEHPVFKFLLGEEPLEGRWFGADPPVINGRPRPYWWRKHLREALLSSPRVEEVRREALEEAAKIAEGYADYLESLCDAEYQHVKTGSHMLVCNDIAKAIRSLSPQGE